MSAMRPAASAGTSRTAAPSINAKMAERRAPPCHHTIAKNSTPAANVTVNARLKYGHARHSLTPCARSARMARELERHEK